MRRIAIALAAALALANCTLTQFEQDAAAVIAKVKSQAPVVIAEIDTAVNFVCSNGLPTASTTLTGIMTAFPNPGPKTAKALRDGNVAIMTAVAACDAYAGTTSTSGKTNLLLKMWSAYNAGRAAAVAANTAAGA